MNISIILTYFAFTTLSTVGFGDYVPISDNERIVGSAVLFLGVMLFSTIMGEFVEIIRGFKEYDKDLDDGIKLEQFLNVLKKFNKDKSLNFDIQKRI